MTLPPPAATSQAPAPLPLEAIPPPAMARLAEETGVQKVHRDTLSLLLLAMLAGAFIAIGALFSTVATIDAAPAVGFGIARLVGGVVFATGLLLVIVAGAELFTGNNLMVMAWASGRVRTGALLRSWSVVYVGNLIGALATAALVVASGHPWLANGAVAASMIGIAQGKLDQTLVQAFLLGVLCNALVCLAVWLTYSARSTTDRILALVPPIAAFVAAGFEHCVANMYLVPAALLVEASATAGFWEGAGQGLTPGTLTWSAFLLHLVPVTLGNLVGGSVLVGGVYWVIYRRPASQRSGPDSGPA